MVGTKFLNMWFDAGGQIEPNPAGSGLCEFPRLDSKIFFGGEGKVSYYVV